MNKIYIIKNSGTLPVEGKHVDDQICVYNKNSEGLPRINLKWANSSFFSKEMWLGPSKQWFVFRQDASLIAELSETEVKNATQAAEFVRGSKRLPYGGVLTLILGAAASVGAKTKNMKGVAVLYKNEEQRLGIFEVTGQEEVINEILISMQQNNIVPYDFLKAEYLKEKEQASLNQNIGGN